jgi:hypothetical protein
MHICIRCKIHFGINFGTSRLFCATRYFSVNSPAGVSVDSLVAYAQEIESGNMQRLDYGEQGNLAHYNQSEGNYNDYDKWGFISVGTKPGLTYSYIFNGTSAMSILIYSEY